MLQRLRWKRSPLSHSPLFELTTIKVLLKEREVRVHHVDHRATAGRICAKAVSALF